MGSSASTRAKASAAGISNSGTATDQPVNVVNSAGDVGPAATGAAALPAAANDTDKKRKGKKAASANAGKVVEDFDNEGAPDNSDDDDDDDASDGMQSDPAAAVETHDSQEPLPVQSDDPSSAEVKSDVERASVEALADPQETAESKAEAVKEEEAAVQAHVSDVACTDARLVAADKPDEWPTDAQDAKDPELPPPPSSSPVGAAPHQHGDSAAAAAAAAVAELGKTDAGGSAARKGVITVMEQISPALPQCDATGCSLDPAPVAPPRLIAVKHGEPQRDDGVPRVE